MKHDVWIAIAALTVICFAIKAAGPWRWAAATCRAGPIS
jgi:hypothetical protein